MAPFAELRDRLLQAIKDPELPRLVPDLNADVLIRVGENELALVVREGMIVLAEASADPTISLSADANAWSYVLQSPPPATYHSFTAFQLANQSFTLDAKAIDVARARPLLERIFELVVEAAVAGAPLAERDLGRIVGRYRTVEVHGVEHEIYFEESGEGTPVLFLHTAGADGRQYQPQLADIELGKSYRMIAVDLPFHGRSMPPLSWDGSPYKLTSALYRDWCVAILDKIVGEKAIVAGGSMGAAMAMVLGAERPQYLRGIVAIEPPFQSKGRRNPFQHNVNVHGALHNSAYVRGLMSPLSPVAMRRRASWIYSQGAPGIYPGDLAFYSDEFDGSKTAPMIDAARVPTVLLSGDYDYSATPADGAKLADLIPGSLHLVMNGLGHFPMCEHPDYFKAFLVRALEHITAAEFA